MSCLQVVVRVCSNLTARLGSILLDYRKSLLGFQEIFRFLYLLSCSHEYTPIMMICGGFAPSFPLPKTKLSDFSRMPARDGAAQGHLAQAVELRKELSEALTLGDLAQVADAADAYLPLAVGMWRAMEQVCICSIPAPYLYVFPLFRSIETVSTI